MSDRFLLPLDGSVLSERAIPYAAALARATNGSISLLHVTTDITSPSQGRVELDVAVRLDELADQLRQQGLSASARTMHGDAAEVIAEAALSAQASAIVMSTHGRSGPGRWLYGSVADRVLRRAEVPILLVTAACDHPWPTDRPLKMLIPLDGSETSAFALRPARHLGKILGADAILVRVVTQDGSSDIGFDVARLRLGRQDIDSSLVEPREYLEGVAGQPDMPFRSVDTIVDVGDPASCIAALARQEGADLIIMATHGRTGLGLVTMGSVATATLHRAHVPTLLVRPPRLGERSTEARPADTGG